MNKWLTLGIAAIGIGAFALATPVLAQHGQGAPSKEAAQHEGAMHKMVRFLNLSSDQIMRIHEVLEQFSTSARAA
ncbi:MAG TPA: hypothetical protein VG820_03730 [Fimbriimonadaceae bacterium]|nr:hypothetical protein [Fimbriimonadaceae bacterium]